MRIALAADHNGLDIKQRLADHLRGQDHHVIDRGVHTSATVDYPALCEDLARQVLDAGVDVAVIIGGTGSGEQIALNKIAGIRAGLCHDPLTAEISRAHNDANVLVLGAKVVTPDEAAELADLWLSSRFKGGRHQRRLDQISVLERGGSLL